MMVYMIQDLKELIEEYKAKGDPILCAFEFTNSYTKKRMYAAFTSCKYCDTNRIADVLNPIRIYKRGVWIGKYRFMNKVI